MKLTHFLGLQTGDKVISTRSVCAAGLKVEEGTVAVVQKDAVGDGESRWRIRFTRITIVDFSFFGPKNWEILDRCSSCSQSSFRSVLSKCENCLRPDYCPGCLEVHLCHIPEAGLSRTPRRPKGVLCLPVRE